MTRLFTSGAEAASIYAWDTSRDLTVSTTQKRTGAYSFYLSGWNYARKQFTNLTEAYVRACTYVTGHGGNTYPTDFIGFLDSAGAMQFSICCDQYYAITAYKGGATGTKLGTASQAMTLNAWQCWELYVQFHDTAGLVTLKLDGATILTLSGTLDTNQTANLGASYFQMGSAVDWRGLNFYFDDIALNNVSGTVNNSWIGRGGVYPKLVTGAGTYTDLHDSAGGVPWECINEVPPSDTDYVYDAVVDQKSIYGGGSVTPATGAVACVNVILRGILDSGAGNLARLIRSNGVDSQGSDVGLDVSAKMIQENIELDPGDTPNVAWTIARVNALEFGAVVR